MDTTAGDRDKGSTRTVDRALELFAAVLQGEAGDSLSSLAREAHLSPSTASRLLGTLMLHGFVRRDAAGRYSPGPRIWQLATRALVSDPLYDLAGPHLEQLSEQTHETASLGVPGDGDEVLYLRQVHSQTHQVQTVTWTGRTIPRVDTALGAAISGLPSATGFHSSVRPDSDVSAVAAPVLGPGGTIIGAISINAPTYRTSSDDLSSHGALLASHARQLSLSLGAPSSVVREVFAHDAS